MPPTTNEVRIVVRDDLRRSRVTVLFRFFMALPHVIWLGLWAGIMLFVLPVQWVATLIRGRPIEGLHEVFGMLVNYTLHVYAYAFLATEKFPGFLGYPGKEPIDALIPPPARQNRWSVGFRGVLALPPLLLSSALGTGVAGGASVGFTGIGLALVVAFLAWFACLVKAAMPAGFRDVQVWALGYAAQTAAYLFLLTDAFPDSDPRTYPAAPRPRHPVRMTLDEGDRRHHRLLVGFRAILATPHVAFLALWGIVVLAAAIPGWLIAVITGRLPGPLHRFFARYVRYQAHATAFMYMATPLFPGFTGRPGSYPLDLELAPPERQSRWITGFRWLLAVPAFMVAGALGSAQLVAAIGAWGFALIMGRVPRGLQHVIAYAVRYSSQTFAYALLLTDRYPHSSPSEREPVAWELAPEAVLPPMLEAA